MSKKKIDETTEEATSSADVNWQEKAAEYLTGWQRTQADFENYRRRTDEARGELTKLATANAYIRMTPILDDFRRAFSLLPEDEQHAAWVTGIRQVEKNLRSTLEQAGLTPIEDGEIFDPTLHEAIAYEEHADQPDGAIIDVVECGWKLGDRVIKPARVRVSKGAPTPIQNTEER